MRLSKAVAYTRIEISLTSSLRITDRTVYIYIYIYIERERERERVRERECVCVRERESMGDTGITS